MGAAKSVLQVEREEVLEGKIDSLMRRLEKMEVEKREAQAIDLKAAETRSTCEECGEYGHVQKNCPEEAKMLDYMTRMLHHPTSATGKVDPNLMQALPFKTRCLFVYN